MLHLDRSGVRAEKWPRIRCSVSQADCGDISGGHREFIRTGSGEVQFTVASRQSL